MCVQNEELKEEFEKYLQQTRNHERVLLAVFSKLGLDAEEASPGRTVVKLIGGALVEAMQTALEAGKPEAAELAAAECVVLAETKDHADWELISKCAEHASGSLKQILGKRPRKWKIRRMSICITRKAGHASYGCNPWD